MPEKSGFFDTTADDPRAYPAREFAEYFARFIGNGIFGGGTNLKVTATGTDDKISIAAGYAWINGYLYSVFSDPLTKTIPLATSLDRIDRVVLRLNVSTPVRAIKLTVLQGTPSATPTAPALVRSGDIYDISLAQVRMVAGQSVVQAGNITDERLNSALCGVVTGVIQQADTSTIFNEFDAYRVAKQTEFAAAWNSWLTSATTTYNGDWTAWFNATKGQWQAWFESISGDAPVVSVNGKAGVVTLAAADVGANPVGDYVRQPGYGTAAGTNAKTISLSPAPSALVDGLAVSFKNSTANTGAVTLNVNSLGAKSVLKSNGSALSSGNLKAGSIYTVRYDGTNFILQGEGGEYGTATAADVLAPKTIGTEAGLITGTIPTNPSPTATITTQGGQVVVPAGYNPGGTVTANISNLTPDNIKLNANVGGVIGTVIPGKRFATRTLGAINTPQTVNITGLDFVPSLAFYVYNSLYTIANWQSSHLEGLTINNLYRTSHSVTTTETLTAKVKLSILNATGSSCDILFDSLNYAIAVPTGGTLYLFE